MCVCVCITGDFIVSDTTHGEIVSKSHLIKPKSDCTYHFPIKLEPNGRPFGSKSIGKWDIQSDFGSI